MDTNGPKYVNVKPASKTAGKVTGGIIAGVAAIIIVASSIAIVPAGNTGVVLTLGKVSETVLQEGFHIKAPFIQSVEVMSNKIQVYETGATAVSKDLQSVSKVGIEVEAPIQQTYSRKSEETIRASSLCLLFRKV